MTLPPVKFKKVSHDHAVALQNLVVEYMKEQEKDFTHDLSVRYHSAIQETSVCGELFLALRKVIESRKPQFALSFKAHQAVTLFFACCHGHKYDDSFKSLVALTFLNEIDRQLKAYNVFVNNVIPY
jgi:hypothetical protein